MRTLFRWAENLRETLTSTFDTSESLTNQIKNYKLTSDFSNETAPSNFRPRQTQTVHDYNIEVGSCETSHPDSPGLSSVPAGEKVLKFRSLNQSDREVVQKLHEDWFPVVYAKSFYDGLVEHRMCDLATNDDLESNQTERGVDAGLETKKTSSDLERTDVNSDSLENGKGPKSKVETKKLFSCVAVQELVDNGLGKSLSVQCCKKKDPNLEQIVPGLHGGSVKERLVGCSVSKFVHTLSCKDQDLIDEPFRHSLLLYILTLGIVDDMRGHGLGSELIRRTEIIARQEMRCGALYLHVITYNIAAIRLYEKLGYKRIREIKDYYRINQTNYNCYLYVKHVNGGRLPGENSIFSHVFQFLQYLTGFTSNSRIQSRIVNK
uniref:N-alpha-acetyltransferase 60 n=1 Tax=Corethron hystrix TaxID=216773 RepID=A0A6U5HDQ8_9STRA|mmetsp:Transcript_29215/g.67023  ORF Transcript_29215/g.67023 Transcript_29215/m.67023 type:complete len:377 (+) Transcript_29215:78-1208(+)